MSPSGSHRDPQVAVPDTYRSLEAAEHRVDPSVRGILLVHEALRVDPHQHRIASGTGRVALPLAARGLRVDGIELSPARVNRHRAKAGADVVPVVIGDMTTTRVPREFTRSDGFNW